MKISSECRALLTSGPMKAIIITYHCVVGGQRRKRWNWAGAVREDFDGGHCLKWTLEEGKDWERQKRHSSPEELRKGLYPVGEG